MMYFVVADPIDIEVVRNLLSLPGFNINRVGGYGTTPLVQAVINHAPNPVLELMVSNGADPKWRSNFYRNLVELYIEHYHKQAKHKTIKKLVQLGVDV